MRPISEFLDFLGSNRMKYPWLALVVALTAAGLWVAVDFLRGMQALYGAPDVGALFCVSLVAVPWLLWSYRYEGLRMSVPPPDSEN